MRSFEEIPGTVERLLAGGEHDRVAVVLLDGFGRRFVERHADHPFLRRLTIEPLAAQFPSTTTAHVTTMHTGHAVGTHGLYEWNVYEPALEAIVTPLRFSFAGDDEAGTLAEAGFEPAALIDGDTLYRRLARAGVRSTVLHPAAFSPSTFDGVAVAGARLQPYAMFSEGLAGLAQALVEPGYAYLYWDRIDATGHTHGPDSPAFDSAALAALDALERALPSLTGRLMVTADHGQVAVHPARVDYLDDLWPELASLLRHRPAGSARDVFLHTTAGAAGHVAATLAERLGDRADVRIVADLVAAGAFGEVGPRLRARLADVCVLPAAGRMAWLRSAASVERTFRGHHGGLHPDEVDTWLGTLYS